MSRHAHSLCAVSVLAFAAAMAVSGTRPLAGARSLAGGPPSAVTVGSLAGSMRAVAVQDGRAYLAVAQRLVVVDVGDRTAPTLLGESEDLPAPARDVVVSGRLAYVAYGDWTGDCGGLAIVDVTDGSRPVTRGTYEASTTAAAVDVSGSHAYLALEDYGLQVVDVTDPQRPRADGSARTLGGALDVVVTEGVAYVVSVNALALWDVAFPSRPELLGAFEGARDARAVAVQGGRAYVADHQLGLLVLDVADPRTPALVGSAPVGGGSAVVVEGMVDSVVTQESGRRPAAGRQG